MKRKTKITFRELDHRPVECDGTAYNYKLSGASGRFVTDEHQTGKALTDWLSGGNDLYIIIPLNKWWEICIGIYPKSANLVRWWIRKTS